MRARLPAGAIAVILLFMRVVIDETLAKLLQS